MTPELAEAIKAWRALDDEQRHYVIAMFQWQQNFLHQQRAGLGLEKYAINILEAAAREGTGE